jgi:hypothetical protein
MSKLVDIRLNQRFVKIEGKDELVKETELILLALKPTYVFDKVSENPSSKRDYKVKEFRIDLFDDEFDRFIEALQDIRKA